jgi:uncharacterized protein YcbK (DUF882 family)
VEFDSIETLTPGLWRWPHIDAASEWACKGTGRIVVVPDFLDRLEALRMRVGFALPISSGYRSPSHNMDVSTTGDDGPHTTGEAADIRVNGMQALALLGAALQLGFLGIGISQKGPHGSRFIHVDTARDIPALWSY